MQLRWIFCHHLAVRNNFYYFNYFTLRGVITVLLDATIADRIFTSAEEKDLINLLLTFEAIDFDATASTVAVVEQPPQNG